MVLVVQVGFDPVDPEIVGDKYRKVDSPCKVVTINYSVIGLQPPPSINAS